MLLVPFTKVKFEKVLFQMHSDKASGSDDFNLGFYQKFWNVLEDGIYAAALSWIEQGMFPYSLNNTVITLIPKCDDLATMRDLRLIALCNVIYKVVSKVLANRLKSILPDTIFETQFAFIKGGRNYWYLF